MVWKCVGGGLMVLVCVLGTTLYLRLEKLGKENQETIAQVRAALAEQRHALDTTQDQLRTFATGNRKPEEAYSSVSPDSHGTILFDVEHMGGERSVKDEKHGERTRRFTLANVFAWFSNQMDWEKWEEEERLDNEEDIAKWLLRGVTPPWKWEDGYRVR